MCSKQLPDNLPIPIKFNANVTQSTQVAEENIEGNIYSTNDNTYKNRRAYKFESEMLNYTSYTDIASENFTGVKGDECDIITYKFKNENQSSNVHEHLKFKQPIYENVKHGLHLGPNLTLRQLFRRPERSEAIYENLCRGCGYGVFEARSSLCNFCSCLVGGLNVTQLHQAADNTQIGADTGENIYENICAKCSALHNTENCRSCVVVAPLSTNKATFESSVTKLNKNFSAVKIPKSKFYKSDKRNFISGIFGSLRRGAKSSANDPSPASHVTTNRPESGNTERRQLEIIHHVDGFDNVFRTNQIFDLQRISELKHSQTLNSKVSTSDQHIYGRLRFGETDERDSDKCIKLCVQLSNSHELLQLPESDSVDKSATCRDSAMPCIQNKVVYSSKHCSESRSDINYMCDIPKKKKLALPLTDSVYYWMKVLRRQVYNYNCLGGGFDDEDYALCIPKSVPSRCVLIHTYCALNSTQFLHRSKVFPEYAVKTNQTTDKEYGFKHEIPELNVMPTSELKRQATSSSNFTSNAIRIAEMVHAFKQNLLQKQMLYQQQVDPQPCVEPSNVHGTTSTHLLRSSQQRANSQMCYEQNENIATFGCCPDHTSISITNAAPTLSTVSNEQCLDSCCSTCHVFAGKGERRGCLHLGNRIVCVSDAYSLRSSSSAFKHETVDTVKERENQLIEKKTHITETVDAYHSVVTSGQEGDLSKSIEGPSHTVLVDISSTSVLINEADRKQSTFNSALENVAALGIHVITPYKCGVTLNFLYLMNNVLLSCSLNTNVLYSNRSQYFSWLQDWLFKYYNPWSHYAQCALNILAKKNNLCITSKLWAILNESVKRHKNTHKWKYDKQGAIVGIGKAPIRRPYVQAIVKCMAMQSELETDVVFDEIESEKLTVGKNNPMKTNDEVVLRTKSKDTFGRSKKAEGKVLDFDTITAELNQKDLNLGNDISDGKLDFDVKSLKDISRHSEAKDFPDISNFSFQPNKRNDYNRSDGPSAKQKEEHIYQPIWKFKTVGESQEYYESDRYCETSSRTLCITNSSDMKQTQIDDSSIQLPSVCYNVDDQGEWETDDEFMFLKRFDGADCNNDATISSRTSHSDVSQNGSTITSNASSTATLASSLCQNLQHTSTVHRTVGIFYSPTEPKIRAIVYNYNHINASQYFAKSAHRQLAKVSTAFQSLITKSLAERKISTSGNSSITSNELISETIPDSVQAWKSNLLKACHAEDEEDMIVSENEILRSQLFKEETECQISTPKSNSLQRFKSASFCNILDIPNEDDKKSITERMRNKLQRGVFKLNMRSPKSEKKRNGIFRRMETSSLYMEEGMCPKYPIFGAPLEQLEMNESICERVPRFVIDCISHIERKDCILQDGLYRASGNKVAIDELKQKLSESYIYDSKLLITDDIHTLTSLLKQFFRELGAPLIPQMIYERMGGNISEAAAVTMLRDVLEEMCEPNRATFKFLIRHLKNVATFSIENRMPASNLAIVWGPCIFSANQMEFVDIGRMNTLTKLIIENYEYIFSENERLVN